MLYLISLLITFNAVALSPGLRDCMSKLLDRGDFTKKQQDFYRQWRGGQGAVDKKYRQFLGNARPGDYSKHTQAKSVDEAKRLSTGSEKNGKSRAQYMPGLNRERIERRALHPDTPGVVKDHKGSMFKYVRFTHPVGYDGGKETYFMRVEITSTGVFHGHPMSVDRVKASIGEQATNGLDPNPIRVRTNR